jgi:undecaprenyl phosphate-alpha-L-ara4FN deformylase
MKLGLRVDADTYRGTAKGVPRLQKILKGHAIKASFFFSVGPDNMGRHLFRLLKPSFFYKMLRSNAPGLYGWDIFLKGTLWPGPVIGIRLADIIMAAAKDGHEIGLHAWDHYSWQAYIDETGYDQILAWLNQGYQLLESITGFPPVSSAVPAWKCTDAVLRAKKNFPFKFNSDCRGESLYYPIVDRKIMEQIQIPVTLPTYDEIIGTRGITDQNYNDYLLSLLVPNELNVLAIHAEVEGIGKSQLFDDFLRKTDEMGLEVVPLGNLLGQNLPIAISKMVEGTQEGREGWISIQANR